MTDFEIDQLRTEIRTQEQERAQREIESRSALDLAALLYAFFSGAAIGFLIAALMVIR